MRRFLLVHYSEIGLKKSNFPYFLKKLRLRLKKVLESEFSYTFDIKFSLGRFLILLPDDFEEELYVKAIRRIFGVKNFMFVYEGALDLTILGEEIFSSLPDLSGVNNFCVRVKRSMKMPFSSFKAEGELGAEVLERGLSLPVRLKRPDLLISIEFLNEHGYFAFKKYEGLGGLSPLSQGKMVALMSSGLDSPVAVFRMMRRGVRVIYLHFHGAPFTDQSSVRQVKALVERLSSFQEDSKLYLIPFGDFQKAVADASGIPARVRVVVYRRMMIRVAEAISRKEKAKGVITGDSLGQVASQTPQNLFAVHAVSTIPIFQPLIGYDKDEIIDIAREIGTYDLSSAQCEDMCANFAPKVPEIAADPYDIDRYEKNLSLDDWVGEILKSVEKLYF